jgi:hypothetical protein
MLKEEKNKMPIFSVQPKQHVQEDGGYIGVDLCTAASTSVMCN